MKSTVLRAFFAVSLVTLTPAFGADDKKAEPAAAKADSADAMWASIEKALQGPAQPPKTRDEAKALYKGHIENLEKLSADFNKAWPTDPRRWKLAARIVIETYEMRPMVGLSPKTPAETKAALAEILAAPDADAEIKTIASMGTVMAISEEVKAGQGTLEDLQKAADEHRKAYPNYKGNTQIDGLLSAAKAEKLVKEKPLDLKFTATDGKPFDLSALRGKVVLIDFWATWCGPCMAEVPNVVATYKKLHEKGFEIVGLSFDQDKDKLEKTTKEKEMTWPQYFDGKGWKNDFGVKFGINSIPRMWLVDKKGMVVDMSAREDLEKKVEKLLAE